MLSMRIRNAELNDAAAMAYVIVTSYRSAHREHIPAESLLQFTYEESEHNWARTLRELSEAAEPRQCIFVVENEVGQLVGVAMGGPEREDSHLYTGEIYVLYLLPEFQRQGLGRQLTSAVVACLVELGFNSLLIRVLKANAPGRRFYEALGGQLVLEEQIEERGSMLAEVGYGWNDISKLLLPTKSG